MPKLRTMKQCIVLLCLCVVVISGDDDRVVTIRQGNVKGHKIGGVYAFNGIPYATAPKGKDKFKAPLPPPTWTDTFDAVDKGIICPQVEFEFINVTGNIEQDDCLIANVYVPDTEETNLPVVVYVHGGAFHVGFGDNLKPIQLVRTQNVIAVTFNYRLGIYGFLCLGTEVAPGNAGLKDQVALLQWVKKNIASFGGNPNEVTIAGYSAGATSVDLLMLSASAEGLFNKVIPESGANIALFAVQIDPLQTAKDYAKSIGFDNADDIIALGEFLSTAPHEKLVFTHFMESKNSEVIFSPCVERDIGVESFLNDTPVNILRKGDFKKLPYLVGFANMEGLLRLKEFESWKDLMTENFSDFLPVNLKFDNDDEKQELANKVKKFYFGEKPVGAETILSYIDYFSDISFVYPPMRGIKYMLEAGSDQIYLYEFSFVAEEFPKIPFMPIQGAGHCYQTATILDSRPPHSLDESLLPEESKKMRAIMRQLWGNFIKTGKPVPEDSELPSWPAVGKGLKPHMSLGHTIEIKEELYPQRIAFWEDIYEKHYKAPAAPAPASIKTEL